MKVSKVLLPVAMAALVAFNLPIRAQTNTNTPAVRGNRTGGRGPSVEDQLARFSEQLKLTEEQKPKVKAILEDESKKRQELQTDSALSPEERRAKRQAMREELGKKMNEVLNADQYKHFEAFQQQQRGRRNQSEGNAGGGGAQ
jgi:Spy/CpxP family protein refolding chaperone